MSGHTSRRLLVVAALGAVLAPVGLVAQITDSLIGTWKLDLSRSTFESGGPPIYGGYAPSRRIMRFEQVAEGIRHVVETTGAGISDSEMYRIQYTFRIDGRAYRADTQMPLEFVSFARTDARTITRTGTYRGKITDTVVYQVSEDGKTLTATENGTNYDPLGHEVPIKTVQVFVRQ